MGQRMSNNICCSVRDKNGRAQGLPQASSQFHCTETELCLETSSLLAFAPLWSSEVSAKKRLAVASTKEVQVYNFAERPVTPEVPQFALERKLVLSEGLVTAIIFTEETTSRSIAIAFSLEQRKRNIVRIWSLDTIEGKSWNFDQNHTASLDSHEYLVSRMVISPSYLLTADISGVCCVWHKNRSFQMKAKAPIHHGQVADLVVDRFFAYSAGLEDKCVCVWSLPDLNSLRTIHVEIPQVLLSDLPTHEHFSALSSPSQASSAPYRLLRVTALRRPLSRWASSQGSARHSATPTGTLYIAGVLAANSHGALEEDMSAGVLMEWSLGAEPSCQCAQIAHDSPIVALVYGPYDNGPLITADSSGMFRVWDCVPRLNCSQQVKITDNRVEACSVVVEPQHGLFTIVGDNRLFIWRRPQPGDDVESTTSPRA